METTGQGSRMYRWACANRSPLDAGTRAVSASRCIGVGAQSPKGYGARRKNGRHMQPSFPNLVVNVDTQCSSLVATEIVYFYVVVVNHFLLIKVSFCNIASIAFAT